MKRVYYNNKPSTIEAVGNGSYLYRWDVEESTTAERITQETLTLWSCYEVRVWNTPTKASITEAVIAALWSPSDEKKLINDYNAASNGILEDESCITNYTEFLAQRRAIKEQIAADFAQW